jgi:murein DD-endopeptidase MepM/ murein hydrolase activator NlpD
MLRRPAVVLVLLLLPLVAAPALGDPGSDKARVDDQIGSLRGQIDEAQRQEGVLTSEISAASDQIRELQAQVDAESARLGGLESELEAQRARLEELNALFRTQTRRLHVLRQEHAAAVAQFEARMRQIYMEDTPEPLSFVLGVESFSDLIDQVELLNDIGRQDARIADRVERAANAAAEARAATKRTRAGVAETARAVAARVEEQRAVRDRLVASRDSLASARDDRQRTLASIQQDRAEYVAEVESLQAESASLAAQIQAAQAAQAAASSPSSTPGVSSTSGVSSAGLVWPVSGAVTSGYGWRWGRMHEGIDIAVGTGTPVVAAAAGTVIQAGWLGGYGNLIVVDHGNGLATAYAHNSSLAVAVGQAVGQGQVLAYSGSTGHSSGPHVHFEVRVNGAAVDPLGYL